MRPPHARRDPRYWPPETPDDRLPQLVAGAVAMLLFFFVLVFVAPVL